MLEPIISIFNAILHPFIVAFINLMMGSYNLLATLHIPYPLGFSIILTTIVIKLLTYPLVTKQLNYSKKMQELAPQLAKIKETHKGDNKRVMEEQRKLFAENGVSQIAGCLPTLLQLPVLFGLYQVLSNVVRLHSSNLVDYINSLVIDPFKITKPIENVFFGIPLGQNPQHLVSSIGIIAISIPVITGLLTFLQSKMMMPIPVKEYKSDSSKEKKEKEKSKDMATQMQGQMLFLMPLMIGFFSFQFPIGLSLYWNTFTIFGIIQQYKISGPGGLLPLWQKIRR